MASQPPQEPGEQPADSQPASPVPAPSEKPPAEPDVDDGTFKPLNSPSTEPVWPTSTDQL